MHYIVSFRSRTNTIKFYDACKREKISASLINTPRSVGAGCGLSVKSYDYEGARSLLSMSTYSSFYGIFESDGGGGYIKIY